MNKKIALILACCAATSFAACNETTEWNFTESCGTETKRCVESTIQVCKDGVWVPEVTCEGATPWCDVTTHTCIAKPVAKDCQDGAQKCDQDAVWTCNNGKWGKTADCAADGKVCNNTTHVCDPKAQPEVTCDHNGTKLTVGATACDGDTTLVTCTASADGTTGELKSAPCAAETPICDANACRAYNKCAANGADVEHNATVCDGSVSKKCNDGTLETVEDCSTKTPAQVCLAETGVCGDAPATACTDTTVGTVNDGKTVCKENNVWTCNNTQLSKTTDCTITDAESAAHLVSVCTPGEQGANATCVKKCAEDYKFGEGENANKCVAAHDQQCKINTVNDKQVAQYRTAESEGGYTDWNNCAKDDFSIYGCKENKECDLTGCADTHEIATVDGNKVCVKKKVNNCGNDVDGNKAGMDSAYCVSDTQYAMCLSNGQDVYTSTEATNCPDSTFKCITSRVNELNGCACTEQTQPACKLVGSVKTPTLYTCNAATGEYKGVACTTTVKFADPTCNTETNGCDYKCKMDLVVNTDGTSCVRCTDPTATSCGEGKYCGADGKCKAGEEPACTTDSCSEGMIKKCVDKKYADAVSCIANGVGTCKSATECDTINFTCNVNYMKVDKECKKYDTVECTTGVCTDSYYFGCPAAATGEAKRYHSAPVGKPADDANGTWACGEATGWTLTCNKVDNVEVYEVTANTEGKKSCTLRAGMCTADTDCTDATKTKCNTTTKTCEASATPAPECTDAAIQCVDETKYKTCTAEGKWDTTEKTVETGLKCEANSLKCIAEIGCVGNISYVCENGESIVENCEDESKVCEAGACVAGGGTTPAPTKSLIISEVIASNTRIVELYNPTDADIDLSTYSVVFYDGTDIVQETVTLSGTIVKNGTYIIGKCQDKEKELCNNHPPKKSFGVSYGRKWSIALKNNDAFVDIIGIIDGVKNDNWKGNNLIRKCNSLLGDSNSTDAWNVSVNFDDNTTGLADWKRTIGTHKAVCDATPVE